MSLTGTYVTLIATVDPNWVLDVGGRVPWAHPALAARFDAMTRGGLLVMGPTTWRTWGRSLLGRVCVVSRKPAPDLFTAEIATVLSDVRNVRSIARDQERVWICGDSEVYKLALQHGVVDVIDLTIVPAVDPLPLVGSEPVRLTYFPANLLEGWRSVKETLNEEDRRLKHRRYERLTLP